MIDGNFYLPEIPQLQHYAGFGFNMFFQSETDGIVGLDGHYGVRYDINEVFSVFGELGLGINSFDPFDMSTFKSGIGCTIFFPNFK